MAQFGKKSEGFVASRAVKITGAETVENYTVSYVYVIFHMWAYVFYSIFLFSIKNLLFNLLKIYTEIICDLCCVCMAYAKL